MLFLPGGEVNFRTLGRLNPTATCVKRAWMSGKQRQALESEDAPILARLRARRTAGVLQIAVLAPLGGVLLFFAFQGFSSVNFSPSALSSRVVAFSWAFLAFCAALTGLALAASGLRWLLFALWPGSMGITVTPRQVIISLGPFGRRRLDVEEMTTRYRFEREDPEELTTEDFMEPEEEIRTALPLIRHPRYPVSLNRVLEKYIAGDPPEHLRQLSPLVKLLREKQQAG